MENSAQTSPARPEAGARDLQATLYREIGISAVAAALHSISRPEPGARPADAASPRPSSDASKRAA